MIDPPYLAPGFSLGMSCVGSGSLRTTRGPLG